jgi:2-hydroxychromene-2-carboxylate isomerase
MPPVSFLFDFISPYAYLAWTQVHAIVEAHGREVDPIPVLFAALLDAHGTLGPAEVPAKRRHVITDVARRAHHLGVPVNVPAAHPFNPLHALRLASLPLASDRRRRLVDALFRATWVEGQRISDPVVVAAIARAEGLGDEAVAWTESSEAKALLRAQTEAALAAGVFGVPTMLVDGELFWGGDALPLVARFLAGDDGLPGRFAERWNDVPAEARRLRR